MSGREQRRGKAGRGSSSRATEGRSRAADGGARGEARVRGDASPSPPPFLVAAVGASAGGLEAFSTLVRGISPRAPLALILVQHLAADQKSLLPELLARQTALEVREARDRARIEPGHVYVVPSGMKLGVIDHALRVIPKASAPGPSTEVDFLFRSIAESYGPHSVGVVLSGAASDGSAGLREIKAAGGITIVQAPEDAKIDAMPRAAIATGAVDLVLPVSEIATELERLARLPRFQVDRGAERGLGAERDDPSPLGPGADPQPEPEPEPEPGPGLQAGTGSGSADLLPPSHAAESVQAFRPLLRLLRQSTGIDLSQYKASTLVRRIERRMALARASSVGDYLAILEKSPAELERLQEDVLIHVTSFFRDPGSFTALQDTIIAQFRQRGAESPLRIWVPGCSSGEEVYSVGIALSESLGQEPMRAETIQIFGTDVSERSIERARAGIYPESIEADVSKERLRRFFSPVEGGYRVSTILRQLCVFARQDITRDPPFSRLDLIVCRNMLIYLSPPAQRRVTGIFHYALRPGGALMLGRAETVGHDEHLFAAQDKKFKIYVRRETGRPAAEVDFSNPRQAPGPQPRRRPGPTRLSWSAREPDVVAETDRLLLERYVPPGVLIDDDLRIVRTRGHTAPFLALPEGDASLDLFKMAHRSLLPALRSAIDEALASGNATVRQTELPAPLDGDGASAPGTTVTIEVIPYTHREARCFLVTFARHGDLLASHDGEPGARPPVRTHGPTEGTIAQLERELAASHRELEANVRDLAATNEELQSANEEILSSNEELQSTNEELDTAKEELQSTNEELSSLNDQLHGRNEELREANNDLANLLSSVRIPIVMVSNDLRIRRFTPAAEGVLNLIASDVGRPIGHIRPNLIHANLESFLAEVMGDVAPREQEVEDGAGRIYSMRVQPCRNGEGDVWGAVLSLVDISSAKLALRLATETAETVMSSVREPSVLLDATLRITHANPAFRRAFGGDGPGAQELQGRPVNELDDGRWNHPALVRALRGVLPERTNFEGLTVELGPSAKSEGGKKVLSFDARRIESGDHGGGVILLMVR